MADWNWEELDTSIGGAEKIPEWVQRLLSQDAKIRENALQTLLCYVANQGSLYTAAAGVVDVLLDYLGSVGRLPAEAWHLMNYIFGAVSCDATVVVEGRTVSLDGYVKARITSLLPLVDEVVADVTIEELDGLTWVLMRLAERSFAVIEILEKHLSSAMGERRASLVQAVADARDAWEEGNQFLGDV
ncbi:hypothetical protein SAMN05192558_108198 [Actinokineospora alba]|uniref:HEAT repeat-containing protein n=1 Tax=Actinokineospora alba TaxID=504798 RepID=A0A1H0S0X3_9PSEU|nr:hypothetical protein [Actinokineospora alba]TDP66844.1 hypothetical protein C8E96_2361 [Actinokineospora alba]SDI48296.1 hypothetical protein SAMN05421871_105209 [Actinokineospora alba]SDP34858.1 hypothetical protein SAMN05192558_108198 [Actinokineospora alba]